MKRFMKVTFLWTLIMLTIQGMLFGNGTSEDAGKTQEPVEIQFWTRQTQSERQEQIQLILDVFETLNPDIKVTMLPVEENEFTAQLAAAGEANRPDLVEIQSFYAMSFLEEGLVNAEANAEVVKSVGQNAFYPGSVDKMRMGDGRLFGIPFHFTAQGFWYRNRLVLKMPALNRPPPGMPSSRLRNTSPIRPKNSTASSSAQSPKTTRTASVHPSGHRQRCSSVRF